MIDMHAHWQPGVPVATLLRNMDSANVVRAIVMPNGGHRFDAALELQRAQPQRFLAFLGFQSADWVQQRPEFLAALEAQLRTGQYKGLGEVLLLHYAIPQRGAPRISIAADAPLALQAFDLAARYRVPIVLHMEAEEETVPRLERVLQQKRDPLVIWAHAGRATASTVDRLLAAYQNLLVDISALNSVVPYTAERNPIIDPQGVLMPEWKALLIKHQDRVLIGSDTPFPDQWNNFQYVAIMRAARNILRQLPAAAAEKIAFANAARILNLPDLPK